MDQPPSAGDSTNEPGNGGLGTALEGDQSPYVRWESVWCRLNKSTSLITLINQSPLLLPHAWSCDRSSARPLGSHGGTAAPRGAPGWTHRQEDTRWSLDPAERRHTEAGPHREWGRRLRAGGCGMRSRRCSPGPFCPFLATVSPAHGGGAPATRKGPTGTTWCGTTCWQRHGVGAQEVQGTGEAGGSRGAGETLALKGSAIGLMAPSPSPHVSSTGGGRERRAEQ